MLKKDRIVSLLLIPFLFFLLYYQAFTADYCYTDEIHQLWYNNNGSNYSMFASQGRWLTGLLFNKLFALIAGITEIKNLRIFSFTGWLLTVACWSFIFRKWAHILAIDRRFIFLLPVYIICCIPVAIYIGWASCMEMFLGVLAALLSCHILFSCMYAERDKKRIPPLNFILSLVAGVISLFIYQSAFGLFLFPFFIYYLQKRPAKPDKVIITGVLFYFLVYIVYYLLFRYLLKLDGMEQSSRAGISTGILRKLSFLVSGPLPAAFSVNFLYTSRSIFSQLLSSLVMAGWLISVFIRYRNRKRAEPFFHIITILLFLALTYLPSMITIENFASYRTLFAFNIAVFCLLTDQALFFLKSERTKQYFTYATGSLLVITGYYNFNFQFVNPLKAEYKAFTAFMNRNMNAGVQTIYFIRAGRFLFTDAFHTLPYKDEFGFPSTGKDWVPEPLVKQYLFESTGNRSAGEKIKIVQFADSTAFHNAHIRLLQSDLLVDMNSLFKDYCDGYKTSNK